MINGVPCKVVDLSTSKTGKHGHAKAHIVGIDPKTGRKMETIVSSSELQSMLNSSPTPSPPSIPVSPAPKKTVNKVKIGSVELSVKDIQAPKCTQLLFYYGIDIVLAQKAAGYFTADALVCHCYYLRSFTYNCRVFWARLL